MLDGGCEGSVLDPLPEKVPEEVSLTVGSEG